MANACPIMLEAIRRAVEKGTAKVIGAKNANKVYELTDEVELARLAFEVRERRMQKGCGKASVVNNTDKSCHLPRCDNAAKKGFDLCHYDHYIQDVVRRTNENAPTCKTENCEKPCWEIDPVSKPRQYYDTCTRPCPRKYAN